MNVRNRLAALFAAGALAMAVGAVAIAAPPTYSISVDKTANPAAVPPSGGTVVFSVIVDNTGTGHLAQVNIVDSMGGCTLGAPTGDTDTDGNLDDTETWTYQCTVNNVTPGQSNTATVNACHSAGSCNNASHDAQGADTVTLGTGPEVTSPPATEAPTQAPTQAPTVAPTQAPTQAPTVAPTQAPTEVPPTINPSQDVGGESDAPEVTQAPTDTFGTDSSGGRSDATWMLVLALGMLLASLLLASPSKAVRQR